MNIIMKKSVMLDSSEIKDSVFEYYGSKHGFKFSDKLKAELKGTKEKPFFKGEVSLEKFRPYKENSQALVMQTANTKEFKKVYGKCGLSQGFRRVRSGARSCSRRRARSGKGI